jgi:hypothetical protein
METLDTPNFIIAGASKAGTGWLRQCLIEHPDVYIPEGPTIDYFSRNFGKERSWYLSHFRAARNRQRVGEKSTSYIISKNVPERIYKLDPDIDLYFVLRDPIQRAYSHYKMLLRAGKVSKNVDDVLSKDSSLVKEGLYNKNINRFSEHFDNENIYIFFFDDLVQNNRKFVKNVFTSLGVRNDFLPSIVDSKYNTTKSLPKYSTLYPVLVSIIRFARKKSATFNDLVRYSRKKGYTSRFHNLIGSKDFPKISVKRWKTLKSLYEKDILRLQDRTGKDLGDWCDQPDGRIVRGCDQ